MSKNVTIGEPQGTGADTFLVLSQNEANDLLALGYRVHVIDPGEGGLTAWNKSRGTGDNEKIVNYFQGVSDAVLLLPLWFTIEDKVQQFVKAFETKLSAFGVKLFTPTLEVGQSVRQYIQDHAENTYLVSVGDFEDPTVKASEQEETSKGSADLAAKYRELMMSGEGMAPTTALTMLEDHFDFAYDRENNIAVASPRTGTDMVPISYDVEGTDILHWLRVTFNEYTGLVTGKTMESNVLSTVGSKTVRSGKCTKTAKRVFRENGNVWIDLGNLRSDCIKLNADGWNLFPMLPDGLGRSFIRDTSVKPIETPEKIELVDAADTLNTYLRPYINSSEGDWNLLVAWLVNHILDNESPILIFIAEAGLGKSTACRALQFAGEGGFELEDLSQMPFKSKDLIANLSNRRIGTFDNISKISHEMSDTWCRSTTGLEYTERKLFTNSEVSTMKTRARIIANAISTNELRDDVKERLVTIRLTNDIKNQMHEDVLKNFLVENHPKVYGAVLTLASNVLAIQDKAPVFPSKGPEGLRMQAYARVVWALDQILGTDGITHYKNELNLTAQEGFDDPLTLAIMHTMVKNGSYTPEGNWVGRLFNSDILGEYTHASFRDRLEGVKKEALTSRGLAGAMSRKAAGWKRLGLQVGNSTRALNPASGNKETCYEVVISGDALVDELRELNFRMQEQPVSF